MHELLPQLFRGRLLPVLVIRDLDAVEPIARALIAAQVPAVEVTLRTPIAAAAIEKFSTFPDLLVGAGSVLRPEQVDEVVAAGGRFAVSPGVSPSVISRCQDAGLPAIPGVATSTEIMAALDLGIDVLKFFPAEASGGARTLRALGGPFGGVRFVPTGGVNAGNAAEYLALDSVAAVGGSWMFPTDVIASGDVATLTATIREAAEATRPAGAAA